MIPEKGDAGDPGPEPPADMGEGRPRARPQSLPPHDLEAEEALLGAMMLSRDGITAATTAGVIPTDFYKPEHTLVYEAIIAAHQAGEQPDVITIAARAPSVERRRLLEILSGTPASSNGPAYARIVRDHARGRNLIALAHELEHAVREGADPAHAIARAQSLAAPVDERARLVDGATFVLDTAIDLPAIWGEEDRVLWALGELLLIVGPAGTGKTTLAAQLVEARLGLTDRLLDLPTTTTSRVLYLACDRPAQIQRALHRRLAILGRAELAERLAVWKGPPPHDFGKHPQALLALARDAGATCVFIDSLKDVALGISDDEVGAGLNSAIQHCLAEGIDVCALHHQRKGQGGTKPKALEDVYGSTWVTAGAGSVILLWGQPGDPLIDLHHLKQPSAEIGPIQIDHDQNTGLTSVFRGDVNPLRVLRQSVAGLTAHDLAVLTTGKKDPSDNARRKAKRTLDQLARKGLAHVHEGTLGGPDGTKPDRYTATAHEPDEPPEEIF